METFDYAPLNPIFCLGDTTNGWAGPWLRETGDDAIIRRGDLRIITPQPGFSHKGSLPFVRAGIRYNRRLAEVVRDNGEVIWLAFDIDFRPESAADNVGNVTLTRGGGQVLSVGRKYGNRKIGLAWPGAGNYNTDIEAEGAHRLVVKIQFSGDTGDEQAWLWVDPDTTNGEPRPETADLTVPSDNLPGLRMNIGFDGVQLKNEGVPPLRTDYDNIFLGRTYKDVDPDFVVSENNPTAGRIPLSVSPNPSAGPLTARWSLPTATKLNVMVFDATGRMVKALPARIYSAGDNALEFLKSTDVLPAGTYQLSIRGPGVLATASFILQFP